MCSGPIEIITEWGSIVRELCKISSCKAYCSDNSSCVSHMYFFITKVLIISSSVLQLFSP